MPLYNKQSKLFSDFKEIKTESGNTIKRIIKYNNGIETEVYPNTAQKYHITSSLDSARSKAADDNAYGWPVLTSSDELFILTIDPYPKNSGWYLTVEGGYTCEGVFGIENKKYGAQTITLPYVSVEETTLVTITVHSLDDSLNQIFRFWISSEVSTGTGASSKYLWTFDDTLADSTKQYTFTLANDVNTTTYLPGKNGNSLATTNYVGGDALTINKYVISNLPFSSSANGGTLSVWVNPSANMHTSLGFQSAEDTSAAHSVDTNTMNPLLLNFSYGQPYVRFGYKNVAVFKPDTTTSDRLVLGEWSHVAFTWTKTYTAETISECPGVTVNGDGSITWASTNFDATKCPNVSVSASNVPKFFYCVGRLYVNGVLKQEGFRELAIIDENGNAATSSNYSGTPKFTYDNLGEGRFFINLGNTANGSIARFDNLKLFEQELTTEQIAAEYGESGGTVRPPEESVPNRYRVIPDPLPTPSAKLKAFVIDSKTIAVAGDFYEFIEERLLAEYGAAITPLEKNYVNGWLGEDKKWKLTLEYKFSLIEILKNYIEPQVALWDGQDSNTNISTFFKVNNADVKLVGRWTSGNHQMYVKGVYDTNLCHNSFNLANYNFIAYLELSEPMTNDVTYTITNTNGDTTSLVYGSSSPALSLKVNQEGYLTLGSTENDYNKKYAYYGWWLGTGGYYPKTLPESLPFEIRDANTDAIVYSGNGTRRIVEKDLTGLNDNNDATNNPNISNTTYLVTGENTYEFEFTNFVTPGTYKLYVPGVGYSYDFKIGPRSWDKALWTYFRGMYLQRSGIAKTSETSKWIYPRPDHTQTWKAKFISNWNDCASLRNEADEPYFTGTETASQQGFTLIQNYLDENSLHRELKGGWFDAADFDRRPFHMECISYMLNAYYLVPNNFTDGQFNIKESGNGIPDILNEIEWGLDYMRLGQDSDGGIAAWVETDSHENDYPWESTKRYARAVSNKSDSVRYAWLAGMLAYHLYEYAQKAGIAEDVKSLAMQKAAMWSNSALKAYNWANDDAYSSAFTVEKNSIVYTYDETMQYYNDAADVPVYKKKIRNTFGEFSVLADIAMYMLTKDAKYITAVNNHWDIFKPSFDYNAKTELWSMLFSYPLLFELKNVLPELWQYTYNILSAQCLRWKKFTQTHRYRFINYPEGNASVNSSAYFGYQGWGAVHPERRGSTFLLYWKLLNHINGAETEESLTYRDMAINAMDWAMGCNEVGRTLTTGLGKSCPIGFLDHLQMRDRTETNEERGTPYFEPRPGISPYIYGNMFYKDSFKVVYFPTINVNTDSMLSYPSAISLRMLPAPYNTYSSYNDAIVPMSGIIPTQRNINECGAYSVAASEFTISETIAGKIYMAAVLMPNGYSLSSEWNNRVPIANRFDCPGYYMVI